LKAVVTGEFFFQNTASGTQITTKSMGDYKTIQNLLSQKGIPFFTFYTKGMSGEGEHPIQPTTGAAVMQRRSSNGGRTNACQTRDH
jgi:hypothetical protein